jgi:hypothetical protein
VSVFPAERIPVPGKRLFWVAIIIVELVLVYVLWRPVRDRFNPHRRAAVNAPVLRSSETHPFEAHLPGKKQPDLSQSQVKQSQAKQAQAKQPPVSQPAAKQPEARQALKRVPTNRQSPVQSAQIQPPQVAAPSRKPSGAIRRSATALPKKSVVINAGLKSPEPVPATPTPVTPTPIPPPPTSLADSFWCNISHAETTPCDCKTKDGDQSAKLVTH